MTWKAQGVNGMSVCHSFKAKRFRCRLQVASCQRGPFFLGGLKRAALFKSSVKKYS